MMIPQIFHRFAILGLLLVAFQFSLEAVDAKNGEALFKANCATCHARDMKTKLTGPALGGVAERWSDYPITDLYSWIRNSQALIATGHKRANDIYNEYNKSVMTAFPKLDDPAIDDILAYVDNMYTQGCASPPCVVDVAAAGTGGGEDQDNTWLYVGILGILGLLALVLSRVVQNLNYMAAKKDGEDAERTTILDFLTDKSVLGLLIFALIVLAGYTTMNNAININRQQGYQPEQPIAFSHELHAGINKIDCQYCHDGARRSKHATVPASNTCMNCHKAIKGKAYETVQESAKSKEELSKIYASAGFNPNSGFYIDNFADKAKDSIDLIRDVFEEWFLAHYAESEGINLEPETTEEKEAADKFKERIQGKVDGHLAAVMPHTNKSIEWVKIHNLPDHVYFNHAQHVSVGKIECQQCHGPVEEMDVVRQYSPLSMGWCINCHRETEVQFTDNDYYQAFDQYHKDLKEGKIEKVKVEDIGGLECQKCHY